MALPPAVVETWESVTGGLLVEGYGMTETSPISLGNPAAATRRPGTVGVPFPQPGSVSSTRTTRRTIFRSGSRASC